MDKWSVLFTSNLWSRVSNTAELLKITAFGIMMSADQRSSSQWISTKKRKENSKKRKRKKLVPSGLELFWFYSWHKHKHYLSFMFTVHTRDTMRYPHLIVGKRENEHFRNCWAIKSQSYRNIFNLSCATVTCVFTFKAPFVLSLVDKNICLNQFGFNLLQAYFKTARINA